MDTKDADAQYHFDNPVKNVYNIKLHVRKKMVFFHNNKPFYCSLSVPCF